MALAPQNDVLNQPVGTNPTAQETWLLGQNEGGDVGRFTPLQIVTAAGAITPDSGAAGYVAVYSGADAIGGTPELAFSGGTLALLGVLDVSSHAYIGGAMTIGAGLAVTGTVDATAGLFTAGNLNVDGAGTIDGVLIVGGAGTFTGSIDTAGVKVGGNSVIVQAKQGTIIAYGTLVIGSTMTLTAGGTVDVVTSGFLASASNLSDVASAGLARKNINQGEVTLSASAASIATDCSLGNVFKATLVSGTGPYTLANPTNMVAGATYIWRITQPGSGSAQTMVYGSAFRFAAPYSNASPPALTATLSAVDYVTGICDGTSIHCQLANTFA